MAAVTHLMLGHSSQTTSWVIWKRPGPSCVVLISCLQLHFLLPGASLATGLTRTTFVATIKSISKVLKRKTGLKRRYCLIWDAYCIMRCIFQCDTGHDFMAHYNTYSTTSTKFPEYTSSNVTSRSRTMSFPLGMFLSCCCRLPPNMNPKSPKKLKG